MRSRYAEYTGWRLEILPRNSDGSTFEAISRRWIIECNIVWIFRNRRLARDYERKVQTSECWLKVVMIRPMLKLPGRR